MRDVGILLNVFFETFLIPAPHDGDFVDVAYDICYLACESYTLIAGLFVQPWTLPLKDLGQNLNSQ